MENFRIVTPTFNAGWMLEETARSVVACLRPNDRYIIVDGGSTDGSIEALHSWIPENVEIKKDSGGGLYDAISTGFRDCNEPLMAWINASDIYLAGCLDWASHELKRTQADLLHFDDFYINENSYIISRSLGTVRYPRSSCLVGWTPLQDGCFWKSTLYKEIGGINIGWKYAGDFDFFLRAFQKGKTRYGRGVVSAFRKHKGQISVNKLKLYEEERREILKSNKESRNIGFIKRFALKFLLFFHYRSGCSRIHTPFALKHVKSVPAGL